MTSELELTENESRYLKLIYRKQHEGSENVSTTSVAKRVGVRPATVTEVFQNLAEKDLLRHESYHGVELTEDGIAEARGLLRKHRILEVLLVDLLGYVPRKACDEASKLDYHSSRSLINSICRNYGHPKLCPCEKEVYRDSKCERG